MKYLLQISLLGFLAYTLTSQVVQSKLYHQRVNISKPMGLHVNFEMEKWRDSNELALQHSRVKADINIDRSGSKKPLNFFKIKLDQDEELFRCNNLTLIKPELSDKIECDRIDSRVNIPEGEVLLHPASSGYIPDIDYIRRQRFNFRMKSKRFPQLNSIGETFFYRMKDHGVLNGIDSALDKYKQDKLNYGKLKMYLGYYVETSMQFDNSALTHTCSGEIYFSLNRTALIHIGEQDYWPDWYIWLFYYTLEWNHGFFVNINNFTCHDNSNKQSFQSNLLYVEKQQFPYRYFTHKSYLESSEIHIMGNTTQEQLDAPALQAEGFQFDDPETVKESYSETQNHYFFCLGDKEFWLALDRKIFTVNKKKSMELSTFIFSEYFIMKWLNDWIDIPYKSSARGEILVKNIKDKKPRDTLLTLNWSDDVYKNYDLKITRKILEKFQGFTGILEMIGMDPKQLLNQVPKHYYHDEL